MCSYCERIFEPELVARGRPCRFYHRDKEVMEQLADDTREWMAWEEAQAAQKKSDSSEINPKRTEAS